MPLAAITTTCDQRYLEGNPPSPRLVRFCALILMGVLYGPQRNGSNSSRAMRSLATATRFDHGAQVDEFHALRIGRLSEEKITNCGTALRITPPRQPNIVNPIR